MDNKSFLNKLTFAITLLIVVYTPILRGSVRFWSQGPFMLVIFVLSLIWFLLCKNIKDLAPFNKVQLIDKLIFYFLMLSLLSCLTSVYKYASFIAYLRLLSYFFFFYLIANSYSENRREALIKFTVAMGFILSIYGILQYLNVFPHTWWRPVNFLASTYVNHNHFSGYLELIIPVNIAYIFRTKESTRNKLFFTAFLCINLIAFTLSQSRGAWVSITIALFVMFIFLLKDKKASKKYLFSLLFIAALLFGFLFTGNKPVQTRVETIRSFNKDEASIETRIKIWQGTVKMIKDRPALGTGLGTFVWSFPKYRGKDVYVRAHYTHNDYLQVMSETGILNGLVMIGLIFLLIKKGLFGLRKDTLFLGITCGLLSMSLHSLIDFNFHIPANMLLFILYASIIRTEAIS